MAIGNFLINSGIELELRADMDKLRSFLDNEVPNFACDGYGYQIRFWKGDMNSEWKLLVKPRDMSSTTSSTTLLGPSVGLIEIEKLGDDSISLKIPPRDQWANSKTKAFDEEGTFYASFIFQLLNALQSKGFVELPGPLPVS